MTIDHIIRLLLWLSCLNKLCAITYPKNMCLYCLWYVFVFFLKKLQRYFSACCQPTKHTSTGTPNIGLHFLKTVSHCSSFTARATRTCFNFCYTCLIWSFSVWFCSLELHLTPFGSWTTFNFLGVPARDWFFTRLKSVSWPARAKQLQWKMALKLPILHDWYYTVQEQTVQEQTVQEQTVQEQTVQEQTVQEQTLYLIILIL